MASAPWLALSRLGANAGRDGVETVEIHPNVIHGFQGLANAGIPEAMDALHRVAAFIANRVAT